MAASTTQLQSPRTTPLSSDSRLSSWGHRAAPQKGPRSKPTSGGLSFATTCPAPTGPRAAGPRDTRVEGTNEQRNARFLSGLRLEPRSPLGPGSSSCVTTHQPRGSRQPENGVNGSLGRRAAATLSPIWPFGSQELPPALLHLLPPTSSPVPVWTVR